MKAKRSGLGRSVTRIFLFGLVVLAIGLGTSTFGMGSGLRMALPSESVSFESYERVGYGRFIKRGVSVVSVQTIVKID